MKKALIIYPMERGLEDTEKLKYEQFARKNDIEIIGEIQFPYFESLKDYKRLLNILKTNGCHELLCNDEFWLFANVYSDGQFLKDLKASNLRLYDRDHRCQVDKIWEMIDKEMTVPLKQAINHALKDVEKEFDEGIQKDRTGVIVVQRQDVNMGNTLSRQFQEKGFSRIIVVAIDHMDQEVANEVENLFKIMTLKRCFYMIPVHLMNQSKMYLMNCHLSMMYLLKDSVSSHRNKDGKP